jgi:hypothetical protein
VFKQEEKNLERDALQLQDMIAAAQSPGTKVKLITFAEPDRLRHLDWGESHDAPPLPGGRIL